VCDTDEMMAIKDGNIGKEATAMTLEPYDFHKLQISSEKYGSELVLPLHKNTLENDGSPEGLCSSEGDA
jgi:hypothetical protein